MCFIHHHSFHNKTLRSYEIHTGEKSVFSPPPPSWPLINQVLSLQWSGETYDCDWNTFSFRPGHWNETAHPSLFYLSTAGWTNSVQQLWRLSLVNQESSCSYPETARPHSLDRWRGDDGGRADPTLGCCWSFWIHPSLPCEHCKVSFLRCSWILQEKKKW